MQKVAFDDVELRRAILCKFQLCRRGWVDNIALQLATLNFKTLRTEPKLPPISNDF